MTIFLSSSLTCYSRLVCLHVTCYRLLVLTRDNGGLAETVWLTKT